MDEITVSIHVVLTGDTLILDLSESSMLISAHGVALSKAFCALYT